MQERYEGSGIGCMTHSRNLKLPNLHQHFALHSQLPGIDVDEQAQAAPRWLLWCTALMGWHADCCLDGAWSGVPQAFEPTSCCLGDGRPGVPPTVGHTDCCLEDTLGLVCHKHQCSPSASRLQVGVQQTGLAHHDTAHQMLGTLFHCLSVGGLARPRLPRGFGFWCATSSGTHQSLQ